MGSYQCCPKINFIKFSDIYNLSIKLESPFLDCLSKILQIENLNRERAMENQEMVMDIFGAKSVVA